MNPPAPHVNHLSNSESLVTTYEATRAGFVALALEKNKLGSPYVEQARALKATASRASANRFTRILRYKTVIIKGRRYIGES